MIWRRLKSAADVSPHFQTAKVDITVVIDEPAERYPELEEEPLVRCRVYNMIKDSGVPIEVKWTFKRE